ncbi:MAG TPA: chromosomal replication initiator protein DnaA [Rhodospirillaceae bacterium]|nr:MAG: chromosomal replication initiation protein DnaA [Alphaproteobacteria bacterium GWF2_58_20]HAU29186.1 chromosomal replication initiator protein DnaA [Rhodospirillaceae bacterium]
MQETIRAEWRQVCDLMRRDIGESDVRFWLEPLEIAPVENQDGHLKVVLLAPNTFVRDSVDQKHGDQLGRIWRNINPEVVRVAFGVRDAGASPDELGKNKKKAQPAGKKGSALADQNDGLESFGIPVDPRYTFANFVVGKPNEFAVSAARRVAESPEIKFNPLFLYSGVGLGKTHLMHAIADSVRQQTPERRVLYISAEKFMYHYVHALRSNSAPDFRAKMRSVDVLLVDDIQFICGKEATQEEFFNTFNDLVSRNRQIVLSADRSPSDLDQLQERVKSRLNWGLVADIHKTTYELRLGILAAKADARSVFVPQDVMEFLAHRIDSNVRELEGALNRIIHYADLIGQPIALSTCEEVLRDLLRSSQRILTIEDIQRKVAEHYSIRIADLSSDRRARAVARPRQVAMFLCKALTSLSLPEIGRKFGGRDHTTVLHAVRKVEELMELDQVMASDVAMLRRTLSD